MNTSTGCPEPYTRYCTCTPSAAIAMRGVPAAGSTLSVDAAGAEAAGGGACFAQAARSRAARTMIEVRMRGTLGEGRDVVTDRQRGGQPGTLDAEQVHQAWDAVIRFGLD